MNLLVKSLSETLEMFRLQFVLLKANTLHPTIIKINLIQGWLVVVKLTYARNGNA